LQDDRGKLLEFRSRAPGEKTPAPVKLPEPSVDSKREQVLSIVCGVVKGAEIYMKRVARQCAVSALTHDQAVSEMARAKAIYDMGKFYESALGAVAKKAPRARDAVVESAEAFAGTVRRGNYLPESVHVPTASHEQEILRIWEMYNKFVPEVMKSEIPETRKSPLDMLSDISVSVKEFGNVFSDAEQLLRLTMDALTPPPVAS
jgi:hypothetical protein